MPHFHQPADDLIQGALIGDVKLLGVVGPVILGIAAHRGTGAAADLGNAKAEQLGADRFRLTGGDDDAGVGHRKANTGRDLGKGFVVNAVIKGRRIDIVGALDPGNADGVRANAMHRLQMLRVHDQTGKLVLVHLQAEQNAQAHVVNAAFHGPVHGLSMVGVIVLGAGGVQRKIALFVVGLLEQDVGSDTRVSQLTVILHGSGRDVDVDPADIAVFVVYAVNRLDAVQNVFNRVVHRVLARFDGKALMAHVLQGDDLRFDLLLGQLFAGDVLILHVVRTVNTAVNAIIGQVKRGENDNAVAVKGQLDLLGNLIHLLNFFGNFAGEQNRRLPVGQTGADAAGLGLLWAGLFKDLVDQLHIVLVCLGIGERFADLLIIDELFRLQGLGIINSHGTVSFLWGQKFLARRFF